MFKKSSITTAALLALGGTVLVTGAQAQQAASDDQRVEVTGSRLKRAQTEGALPVTVIDRAAIEASGQVSVAELLRDTTFSSFGNFKPQSGSSAQALSDIDLRGLGSNRTLVLVDGRRISKAPFSGQSQDLNQIPLAAVERIEILSDGASAVYGSDAIGGVVNVILRKNFNGTQITYGEGNPQVKGGDTKEASVLLGASSAKGRVFAGVSLNDRGMIFTRDQIGGDVLGVSSFGNNYRQLNSSGAPTGAFKPVPGFDCTKNDFWFTAPGAANNTCSFNFNASAANEAAVGLRSVFANGEFNVNDDWTVYATSSISNIDTFGRYAPTPVQATLSPTSPAYLTITAATPGLAAASPLGLSIRHRMAAAGPRDSTTDATVSALMLGTKGRLFNKVDVDAGFRVEKYKYVELGRNYIVRPLLEQSLAKVGGYNIFDPFSNSADVLNSFKATIARDSLWNSREMFVTASMDLFKIGNRSVTGLVGFETRKEKFADLYDPQSEAGIIEGSAGNSAAGSREVSAGFFELAVPLRKDLELTFAGRTDSYKAGPGADTSSFSPKVAARWQPLKKLTLRGSYGEGFRAPTLDVLTQKPSFSSDPVADLATCKSFGRTPAQCGDSNNDGVIDGTQPQIQVDSLVIANPALGPESSKQQSLGLVFDATDWLSLTVDAYKIRIDGRITTMSAQTVINRTRNPALGPVPAAFSVKRDAVTGGITSIIRGTVNEGTVDMQGYDISARTDFKLGSWGRLRNQLQYSKVDKFSLDGGANLSGEQGAPSDRWALSNTWTWKRMETVLTVNHIGAQRDIDTKAYTTANLSLTYRHPTKTTLSVGVRNLENKKPELISYEGRPWNFYLYDALGRQVYFRVSQSF